MTGPGLFSVRPATVEAWQWDGSAEVAELISDWVESNGGFASPHPYEQMILFGDWIAPAKPGDWIIRDIFGDFWPMDAKLFPGAYAQLVGK